MVDANEVPVGINVNTPNVARIYDFLLGGRNNFAADREAAEKLLAALPELRFAARANRAFLRRAVRFLAGAGIRQYLDMGTGLPAEGSVHEVARGVLPEARVVYVDNDPVVRAHARALLAGVEGVAVVQEDLRRPEDVLAHPETRRLIDFREPVAVLFLAALHFVSDEEDPAGIVATVRDAVAPGSYLVISHGTAEGYAPEGVSSGRRVYDRASAPVVPRTREQIQGLFAGLDLVEPGLVNLTEWRPDDTAEPLQGVTYAGVARRN